MKIRMTGETVHEVRGYEKHEFCKSVGCTYLDTNSNGKITFCKKQGKGWTCSKTAKEFHCWMIENGFVIVKDVERN